VPQSSYAQRLLPQSWSTCPWPPVRLESLGQPNEKPCVHDASFTEHYISPCLETILPLCSSTALFQNMHLVLLHCSSALCSTLCITWQHKALVISAIQLILDFDRSRPRVATDVEDGSSASWPSQAYKQLEFGTPCFSIELMSMSLECTGGKRKPKGNCDRKNY